MAWLKSHVLPFTFEEFPQVPGGPWLPKNEACIPSKIFVREVLEAIIFQIESAY